MAKTSPQKKKTCSFLVSSNFSLFLRKEIKRNMKVMLVFAAALCLFNGVAEPFFSLPNFWLPPPFFSESFLNTDCKTGHCAHSCLGHCCGHQCGTAQCAHSCCGRNCGEGCDGVQCALGCKGDHCAQLCNNVMCGQHCEGYRCAAFCKGNMCAANCKGLECDYGANDETMRAAALAKMATTCDAADFANHDEPSWGNGCLLEAVTPAPTPAPTPPPATPAPTPAPVPAVQVTVVPTPPPTPPPADLCNNIKCALRCDDECE